jgi:diacylglycerol kinase family enzyme
MKRIGVIVNPASGNGAGKAEGEKVIAELQRETEVLDLTGNSLDESRAKAQAAINDLLIDGLVAVSYTHLRAHETG